MDKVIAELGKGKLLTTVLLIVRKEGGKDAFCSSIYSGAS